MLSLNNKNLLCTATLGEMIMYLVSLTIFGLVNRNIPAFTKYQ